MIRTVLGDVEVAAGPILAHEHLQLDLSHNKSVDNVLGHAEEADVTADLYATVEAHGLKAVADLSTPGAGRDVAALARISRNAGVAVVAATGLYWEPLHQLAYELSEAQLAARMIGEIEEGVDGAGRCGVIKIGTDNDGLTPEVERLFAAAVTAAMTTGVSIVTHTSKPAQGRWHVDFFKAHGMDLSRVLISHMHKFSDVADIAAIAGEGVFVGFDQIGFAKGPTGEQVADLTVKILQEGLGEHLILSSDLARKSRLVKHGGTGYGTVFSGFLGLLRERGVDEASIDMLMQSNPRRILSIVQR